MSTKTRNQPLPAKEESLFRMVVKMYESKQYKKGLKSADQVLKKFPEHGETLAMKGLILNCVEKKAEAYECVRAALKADIKSYVCWHVYGILYRSDRVYDQAAKCYLNALRWDDENLQILKDLGHLQMQLRDIPGLVETSSSILGIKSNNRANWVLLTVAHHLDRNYGVAIKVLDTYLETVNLNWGVDMAERYEMGELQMYKASILMEAGDYKGVVQLLKDRAPVIRDKFAMLEMQAEVHLKLGEKKEAEAVFRKLIATHPDNYEYHDGLRTALDLETTPDTSALASIYDALAAAHPESGACKRIPLDFLTGPAFLAAAETHIKRFVCRGIPSLYADLKPLLADRVKADAVWSVYQKLKATFEPDAEPQVWLALYAAQHASLIGDTGAAIALIESALTHEQRGTALVDLYSVRADILASAGDSDGAAAASDVARRLDLSDRFVNCMAVKYAFRNGDVKGAETTALMFARDADATGSNLFDMQVMWYELESARAHRKKCDLGMTLKMCNQVVTHFADFREDQFDFHSYCIRKVTLRAYLSLIAMEDDLYGHAMFGEAATLSINCYLELHDNPPGLAERKAEEAKLAAMGDGARTKYIARRKKEDEKKARAAAEKLEKDRAAAKATKKGAKFDEDPKGEKLAGVADPLAEAAKLLVILKDNAAGDLTTQLAAFEVAIRQNKPLLALQATKRVRAQHSDSAHGHAMTVRLADFVATRSDTVAHAVVRAVLTDELQSMTGGKTADQLNSDYVAGLTPASPLPSRLAAAQAHLHTHPDKSAAAADILAPSSVDLAACGASVDECVDAHAWLVDAAKLPDAADAFAARARAVHKWSSVFAGESKLPLPEADLVAQLLESLKVSAAAAQ